MPVVLVLDGEWESSLAIVRSLGRKGIKVVVGSARPTSLAYFSKYCRIKFNYSDPLVNMTVFQNDLLHHIRHKEYDLIIPVTDSTIFPLMQVRNAVEKHARLALPANTALDFFMSKGKTYALAGKYNIPFPETSYVTNSEDLAGLIDTLEYPVVLKPDRSKIWTPDGRGVSLSPVFISTKGELEKHTERMLQATPVLIQKQVIGEVIGLGIVARQGQILTSFQFRSSHETPITGGISSYRITEEVSDELLRHATKLIQEMAWDGVAHIEFLEETQSKEYYFMEVNGRFWASLPLAVESGANFPYYLYGLHKNYRLDFDRHYRIGLSAHQLYRELDWFKEVVFKRNKHRAIKKEHLPTASQIVNDMIQLLSLRHKIDTFDLDDPVPGMYDVARCFWKIASSLSHLVYPGAL
ncbi:MAG: ATP-grasp domain-containing protein [Deltaproteobacteria bacterium]|nr:ATP-grasp domain-containing protein [Deltaproteobacteria bacterium]